MTRQQFLTLQPGTLIRHKKGSEAYRILCQVNEGTFIASREVTVTNPDEWDRCEDIPLFMGGTGNESP